MSKYQKWRAILNGGDSLLNYLEQFSTREDPVDFNFRKKITYSPNYAKAGLHEIRNTIYQRFADIQRSGGSDLYQEVVNGKYGGVDLAGSTMSAFLGYDVLTELLFMQQVGIYVDNATLSSLDINSQEHPYLYIYKRESILGARYTQNRLTSIYLQDAVPEYDDFGVQTGSSIQYRYLEMNSSGTVDYQLQNENRKPFDQGTLDIPEIPFVMLELPYGLLEDVADAQIALINMNSADIHYAFKSNFPFYVEQADLITENALRRQSEDAAGNVDSEGNVARTPEIQVGAIKGRRYGMGVEAPSFIHPSAEPMTAAMAKEKQIVEDIRLMLDLSLANLAPKTASAESKQEDSKSKESGVMAIAAEVQRAEKMLTRIWEAYEVPDRPATIQYPTDFELKSEPQRISEGVEYLSRIDTTPTLEAKKNLLRLGYQKLFSHHFDMSTLLEEIDSMETIIIDSKLLMSSIENGILDKELAASLLHIPSESVDKAKAEHVERLRQIAIAQSSDSAARGLPDFAPTGDPGAVDEKAASRETDQQGVVTDNTRGPGK